MSEIPCKDCLVFMMCKQRAYYGVFYKNKPDHNKLAAECELFLNWWCNKTTYNTIHETVKIVHKTFGVKKHE